MATLPHTHRRRCWMLLVRYINNYDAGLIWRNLFLLLCVSFVPFPTALFSEFYGSRTAFILYTASFAAVGLAKLWVWHYAIGPARLVDVEAEPLMVKRISRRSLAQPLGCALAILLSFVSLELAPFVFLSIPLLARLSDRTHRNGMPSPRSNATHK